MIWLTYVLLSFVVSSEVESISKEKDKKSIKKFNIYEDSVTFPSKNLENLIPSRPKELLKEQIDQIKLESKNFVPKPVTYSDIAIITTSHGSMKLELYPDKAPNHCLNFKKLANSGFYDGTIFHRVIPGFMIQGGDPNTKGENNASYGTGGHAAKYYGIGNQNESATWTLPAEFNSIKHREGILSMARANNPNSGGSQFFICAAEAPHLNGKYTVFGQVIEGIEIVDQIVNLPRDARDNPNRRIEMKVRIEKRIK